MKILINVSGGCVTGVFANTNEPVEIILRDFDNIDEGFEDPVEGNWRDQFFHELY